ncbi:hypothetical protein F8M41_024218 [Gigaspora margarita]|uniref:Uncharacterized protein n=1 Tax=Gigaspora margarita TaxID=4874 RepID=A0A8H4AC16_GIGMA|nr:hypothetical protein F8M41_024218 [Gigaspora margarita]
MENSNKNEIYDQFLEADKIIKELPIISSKHPDYMYTSKIIDAQKISNTIKDSTLVELNDTKKFDMYST